MTSSSDSGGSSQFDVASLLTGPALEMLPPEFQSLLKPGKTPDRIKKAITWAAHRDPRVLAQHRARGHNVKQFEDIQSLSVEQVDTVARHFARKYRRLAMTTGAFAGLPGGFGALIAASADVQLTAVYAVRMVACIAQSYGYDTTIIDEQAHLAEVLALAAGIDSLRGVGTWLTREGVIQLLPELLPKVLMRLSVEITQEQTAKWVGRLIPGVGAAVGGAIDYTFLRVAGDRAIAYYHHRYLVDHGLILPVSPTAPQIAAPGGPVGVPAPQSGPLSGQAMPVPPPARIGTPVPLPPRRKPAPERFAIYLAIFAVLALGITILACYGIGALVVYFVQHPPF